jgi:hypothetical protein
LAKMHGLNSTIVSGPISDHTSSAIEVARLFTSFEPVITRDSMTNSISF